MRVANFFYTGKHWLTVEAFAAHLANYTAPAWVKGLTWHHTIKPTAAQWRGLPSIDALARFYRQPRANDGTGAGWDRGPHLVIAPDGIWEFTPLNMTGIHAGACNASRYGMEITGNYDRVLWPEPIHSLVIGTSAALCHWAGFPVVQIVGHQDCLHNKTCPGTAIHRNIPVYRAEVQARLDKLR